MKHRSLFDFRLFLIIPLCLAFAISCAQATELPNAAKLVPPNTVLLIEIDDVSKLKSQFEKTSFYGLYKDPAMKAFFENTKAKWQEHIDKLDGNNILRTFANCGALPQGKAALAFVYDEKTPDSNNAPLLIITQWGSEIEKIRKAVDEMLRQNTEYGGHKKAAKDYRGVKIETMVDEIGEEFSYCFIDDCFMMAFAPNLIEFAVAHIKGATSSTLADEADYNATLAVLRPHKDVRLYVGIKALFKAIAGDDDTGEIQKDIATMGVDNVRSIGLATSFAANSRSSVSGKAFIKIDGQKKGVCKMLATESAPLKVPPFVSSSACSLVFFNLNIERAFEHLTQIVTSFSPQAAALLYTPLATSDSPDQPGLKLKDDLVNHLGTGIIIAQTINKPFKNPGTGGKSEYLIALAVDDRSALEKSMSLLHDKIIAPGDPDSSRELMGHTIYLVNPASFSPLMAMTPPVQAENDPEKLRMPSLAFAFTDTHMLMGVEATVERAIRNIYNPSARSLASEEWFRKTKSAIAVDSGLTIGEDAARTTELAWWTMKKTCQLQGQFSMAINAGPIPLTPVGFAQLIDPALLPEFEEVAKYYGLTTFYGLDRPDGFFFEFNYLNPSGK